VQTAALPGCVEPSIVTGPTTSGRKVAGVIVQTKVWLSHCPAGIAKRISSAPASAFVSSSAAR
jgi:hypothetical protein